MVQKIAHALPLSAAGGFEALRTAIVGGCAIALIAAGPALPF